MDTIILKNCRFYGYHGAFPEENKLGQIFLLTLRLTVDLLNASLSDQLEDTVHYGEIFECVRYQAEEQSYQLLEGLAGAICQDIFHQFPLVSAIEIDIFKENPPIKGHYDAVGVHLERVR